MLIRVVALGILGLSVFLFSCTCQSLSQLEPVTHDVGADVYSNYHLLLTQNVHQVSVSRYRRCLPRGYTGMPQGWYQACHFLKC